MSPEEKELLNKAVSLAEDNNKMLHAMKRSQRVSNIMNFLYWAVIIGSAVGAYYFIEPYFDEAKKMYESVSAGFKAWNP